MMEVLIVKSNNTTWDITETVKSVEWFGRKNRAPRSVRINFVSLTKGYHQRIKMAEGEGVFFKWKNKELFRGIIFETGRSKSGNLQIVAHDNLMYLLKNTASRVFQKAKASDIFRRICNDFQIPIGTITDTVYVIDSKVYNSENLYDMILEALSDTHKNTSDRFYVYSQEGKVNLIRRIDQMRLWVIESGTNLVDYNYHTSINDTATRVIVEAGETEKTIIATAENKELQKRFGILQYYERTTEKLNQAQAQEKANQLMRTKGQVNISFKVNALGIPDVISGKMVRVIDEELEVDLNYYVDYDFHLFEGRSHTMQLELTTTW